jgi:peptidoglycan/xylan/chitin deacetylase (PgdA/CDA1 family)
MSDWVCLMYHDVTVEPMHTAGGKEFFSVTRAVFDGQLRQLADLGLRACTVEQAVDARAADSGSVDASAAGPMIACSFDDGDAGQFERAFPVLVSHGMSATFFITTDWVGRPGYVSWNGLREMKAAGMSLQSHTRSHPFLSELDAAALREELHASRAELDQQLNQRTTSLAFPGGDPPRRDLRPQLHEEGYSVIATSRWGINRPRAAARKSAPVWVNRCTIRGDLSPEVFGRIAKGDRWLAARKELREGALRAVREFLGPTRYARWRRRVLSGGGQS